MERLNDIIFKNKRTKTEGNAAGRVALSQRRSNSQLSRPGFFLLLFICMNAVHLRCIHVRLVRLVRCPVVPPLRS